MKNYTWHLVAISFQLALVAVQLTLLTTALSKINQNLEQVISLLSKGV